MIEEILYFVCGVVIFVKIFSFNFCCNWHLILFNANQLRAQILPLYTVPKEIHFSRYNMKCSGDNVILRGIVHVVSCFPLHFMLYRGNLDYFSDSVAPKCPAQTY